MSENIDPYLEAESTLDAITFSHGSNVAESYAEYAQAYATLALAYEQRTANLIALMDAGYTSAKVAGVDYTEVADTIKERLGL